MEEVEKAINNKKFKKSSGPDGIIPEVLVYGGHILRSFLLAIFNHVWMKELMPSDFTDTNVCILVKKGKRSHCGNYRGRSLLSVVGKLFADVLLQRLRCIAEAVYPESQSGCREGRSTIDGMFTLRQVMEKCREQRQNLHIMFIDFTKAFDSVNRDMLFKILGKLGCPPNFIRIIKNSILIPMQESLLMGNLPIP